MNTEVHVSAVVENVVVQVGALVCFGVMAASEGCISTVATGRVMLCWSCSEVVVNKQVGQGHGCSAVTSGWGCGGSTEASEWGHVHWFSSSRGSCVHRFSGCGGGHAH